MMVSDDKMKKGIEAFSGLEVEQPLPLYEPRQEPQVEVRPPQYEQASSSPARWGHLKLRKIMYGLFIFLSLTQVGFFAVTVIPAGIPLDAYTSIPCLVIAITSFVWSCVMVAYHNRPNVQHKLCKVASHLISFKVAAVIWGAPAILSTLSSGIECASGNMVWCGLSVTECALSWTLIAASIFMTRIIRKNAEASGIGLQDNIAGVSDERSPSDNDNPPSYKPDYKCANVLPM